MKRLETKNGYLVSCGADTKALFSTSRPYNDTKQENIPLYSLAQCYMN
jgi:hypothetical protein